jgi:hypothetical protein
VLLLCALIGLAGCGNLPRPFQPDEKAEDNRLLILPDRGGVVVRPVEGLPDTLADELAERLADSLRRENVLATTRQGNAVSFTLDGVMLASASGAPAIQVALKDPAGRILKAELLDLPRHRTGAIDVVAAAKTMAASFAPLLQPEAITPPPPRPSVRIGQVSGAPGSHGDAMLTRALDFALRRNGVKMAGEAEAAGLVVNGAVAIVPKGTRMRGIDVVWTVQGADGGEIGQVQQQNDLPAELIERAWGDIAVAVADAAAEGIVDLVERAPAPTKP